MFNFYSNWNLYSVTQYSTPLIKYVRSLVPYQNFIMISHIYEHQYRKNTATTKCNRIGLSAFTILLITPKFIEPWLHTKLYVITPLNRKLFRKSMILQNIIRLCTVKKWLKLFKCCKFVQKCDLSILIQDCRFYLI